MTARRGSRKEVPKVTEKSQTFSMDILIALGIFLAGIVVFLYLISGSSQTDVGQKLMEESEALPMNLIAADEYSAGNVSFVIGNKVDGPRLTEILGMNYTNMKGKMDVVSDFCIHFEDENKRIIDMDDDPCYVQYSMGDPKLVLVLEQGGTETQVPCGTRTYVC